LEIIVFNRADYRKHNKVEKLMKESRQ